jgi:hypothetical protein
MRDALGQQGAHIGTEAFLGGADFSGVGQKDLGAAR